MFEASEIKAVLVSPAGTALLQRQWRAATQRTVHLAVTVQRDCLTRYGAACEAAQATLTRLCNALLLAHMLPSLGLGALRGIAPAFASAGRRKLARALARLLACLEAAASDMLALAQRAAAAEESVAGAAALSHAADSGGAAVFASASLVRIARLMHAVPQALAADAANKCGVCAALGALCQPLLEGAAVDDAEGVVGGGHAVDHVSHSEGVRLNVEQQLKVYCVSWLLSLDVSGDEVTMGLAVVAEDMVGC